MSEVVFMTEDYFPFLKGQEYLCVGSGKDYVVLKCRGQNYCVPLNMTHWG